MENLTEEQVKKVVNYFSNLNNLKYFLGKDEKDCKANKSGTKANIRTKYGIITINLSTLVDNNVSKVIKITSEEISLNITMCFYFGLTLNNSPYNAINTLVWDFNPYCKKPELIKFIHWIFEKDYICSLRNKIQSKIQEIANN